MIRNCNDPTSMLETFKKLFPFFLGENIEKSLKIFRETKDLKAREVIEILRHHINLPNYLLAHLRDQKKLKEEDLADIGFRKQEKLKMRANTGSREAIEQLK